MLTRTTLNGLQPRTLADATRDPFDHISGPHYPASVPLLERIAACALAICVGAALALLIVYGPGGLGS